MTALQEALEYEAKETLASMQEMMADMITNMEEGGEHVRDELDEYTVRKMLLARHYILKDIEKLNDMKKAIMQDWDKRINSRKEEVSSIESMVDYYIRNKNNGKSLRLDVATPSLRRVKHKIKVNDKEKVQSLLEERNLLPQFLKDPELDERKVQNYLLEEFQNHVEALKIKQIELEKEENGGKITKKREKEIELEITDRELVQYKKNLPEGIDLELPSYSLSIRSNI